MLKTIKRILDLCGSYKSRLIAGIVCSLIYSVCTACSIFAILNILLNIRELTNDHIRNSIWILLVSIVGKCIMKYLISIYMSANGYNVFCEKRMEIGDRMKRAPMGFFSEQNLGMINTALSSATTELENFSMVAVENMVGGIIQAVCVMIVLLFFNWKVALLSLIGLLLSSVTLKLIKIRTTKQAPRREASREIMVTKVLEYIRGISVIRSFGRQPDDEIHQVLEETKNANITMEKQVMSVVNLYKGILEVFSGLIIGYSAWLMLIGQLTFPIGVMFLVSSFMIYGQMETMGNGAFLLRVLDSSLNRMEKVMNIPVMDEGAKKIEPANCDIELKNVSFGYDSRPIIKKVSLKIPQGTSTAIVGYSGSGKTTLCNLITRFWDVDSGEVLFGGHNVKEYACDDLLSNISMVFQNVYLFHDTIANNIKFGKPDATREEVKIAAKKACCYDFIMKLPDGFDTIIGEGGSTLSGGERQRISIARAILKDAPVIILDEATSSVDPENEHELLKAIEELTKGKTLISIAHRMTTVRKADQIIVLSDGEIVQQGTHKELIAQEGVYKNFLTIRTQSVGWQI
ncbi:ABC transporter ATP-binding protein [Angelakisella massiliensis]|uniref:ABC transporter ATP-binding protein n=1 Tax=Angelakisella massiliensis TaxID=1871018 RepID=UPI0008F8182C|nr:ABC transporter ATP-binding protein [Angelakisella massiliensis]